MAQKVTLTANQVDSLKTVYLECLDKYDRAIGCLSRGDSNNAAFHMKGMMVALKSGLSILNKAEESKLKGETK